MTTAFLVLATIPAGGRWPRLQGFLRTDVPESPGDGHPVLRDGGLPLRLRPEEEARRGPLDAPKAVAIGIAQALAILPGVSRSGTTISTALLVGTESKEAGRFSFLLGLPVILGAAFLELKGVSAGSLSAGLLVAAFVISLAVGIAALKLLLGFVDRGKLHYFGYYLVALGIVCLTSCERPAGGHPMNRIFAVIAAALMTVPLGAGTTRPVRDDVGFCWSPASMTRLVEYLDARDAEPFPGGGPRRRHLPARRLSLRRTRLSSALQGPPGEGGRRLRRHPRSGPEGDRRSREASSSSKDTTPSPDWRDRSGSPGSGSASRPAWTRTCSWSTTRPMSSNTPSKPSFLSSSTTTRT